MEFVIEMRRMKPGLKLKSIHAVNIRKAQEQIIFLLLTYCQADLKNYRIKMIETRSWIREFYILFEGRQQKIILYEPMKE